jgi:peroxiredoxin
VSCRVELVQLDRERDEFERRGIEVVGVSFDSVADLAAFRKAEGLRLALATDPGRWLAHALGVVHKNVMPGKDAFYPTKVLISNDAKVLWVHAEDDLRVREGPESVLAAIDAVWN